MTNTASKPAPQSLPVKARAVAYFKDLQNRICRKFEELDGGGQFECTPWEKGAEEQLSGGGEMRLMRGEVFEKVGVNFSEVYGEFSDKFSKEIPGTTEDDRSFWASGISLVAHMKNPKVPAVHMNLRHIVTAEKAWFGGGADLTPSEPIDEDTLLFHTKLEQACSTYDDTAYTRFKDWCDEYFFLPHRGETRGVGGIFFDYLEDNPEETFAYVQQVGEAFLEAFAEIVARRKEEAYTEADKEKQLIKRGRYAEFNLIYDRGTRFGLMTGGNTEAILMSLPPEAKWP